MVIVCRLFLRKGHPFSTHRVEVDRARAFQLSLSGEIPLFVPPGTPENLPPFQRWENPCLVRLRSLGLAC